MIKKVTFGEVFKEHVKYVPDKEYLIDWVTGKGKRRLTYAQVAEDVYKLCRAMKGIGVKKGDMVAIVGYNLIEGLEVIHSSTLSGWAYGWQDPGLPDEWLVTILSDRMAAKVLFFEDKYREKIIRLMPKLKTNTKYYISLDGPSDKEKEIINYSEFISNYSEDEVEIEVKPEDFHCIYMSGGTTGPPKGAMWTYEAAWHFAEEFLQYYGQGPEDVCTHMSPTFWSTWMPANTWPAVQAGSSVVVLDGRLDLDLVCEAITKEKATFGVVPSFVWLELASWPEEKARKYDLSSFKYTYNIGITLPLETWRVLKNRWGITSGTGIAACEYNFVTINTPRTMDYLLERSDRRISSMGRPCPWAIVKIVDAQGREAGVGEVGELIMKRSAQFYGYLGQPEKTSEVLKEGWVYSGNLVSRDKDGYIYLEAKKEDVGMFPVDKEGKYIMPYRVQERVTGMEGVIESSLITMHDPDYGAKYVIIVRPKEGIILSKEEVIEIASKEMPGYLIKDVIFRKEPIPKTPSGKILVRELAKEYGGIIPEV